MYMLIVSEILIFRGLFSWRGSTLTPLAVRSPDGYPGLTVWLGATMTGLLLLGSLTARYGRIAVVEEGDRSKLVLGYAMTVGIGVLFLAVLAFEWSNLLAEGLRWTTGPYGGNLLRTGRTARWSPHRRAGTVRDRHLPRPSPRPLQRQPESDGSNGRGVLALPDRHLDRDIHLHLLRHHLTNQLHHLFRSHDHSTTVGTETTDTECAGHEPAGSLSARRLSSRRSRSDPSLLDGAVACPTWPACNGQWIVSLSDPALAAAWGHRFVTLVVGLLLLGTMVVAWIRPVESRVRLALGVAGVLYPGQIVLGALTAVTRTSSLLPAAHLVVGMGIFSGLLVALLWQLESESAPSVAVTETEPAAPAGDLVTTEQASSPAHERSNGGADLGQMSRVRAYVALTKPKLMWFALSGRAGLDGVGRGNEPRPGDCCRDADWWRTLNRSLRDVQQRPRTGRRPAHGPDCRPTGRAGRFHLVGPPRSVSCSRLHLSVCSSCSSTPSQPR